MSTGGGGDLGIKSLPFFEVKKEILVKHPLVNLLTLFLLNMSVYGQVEHAPTVDQCRADEKLWTAQVIQYDKAEADTITNGTTNRSDLTRVSFKQLNERMKEMFACAAVDPSNNENYNNAGRAFYGVEHDRFRHFIERHNLMTQFLAEDAAGKH